MEYVRLSLRRQDGAQGAQAADAEHDFLTNARVLIPAIQVTGDPAIVLAVLGQVGIEQIERHAADLGDPYAGVEATAGERHLHEDRNTLVIEYRFERNRFAVETVV